MLRLCEHVSKYIFWYNNLIESLIFRIRQYSCINISKWIRKQNIQKLQQKEKKIESINHNKISSLKNYIFTTGAKNRSVSFSSRTFSSMYTALNQRKEKMVEICLNATRLRYVYFVPRCVRFSFVTEFNRPRPRVDNLKTTNAQTRTINNKRGRLD